jgi:EAL domain-containing protein (putative c-di-GMP-specific phosphodiesterase class I)/GGDEF domain-containing protein
MTLKRQVLMAGAFVFALALLGVAAGQWLSGREFVREQLAAHAHEAATALALALSSGLRDGDAAMVRTTLLPVFDRGYYRRIVIRDAGGSVVESMQSGSSAAGVPRWFADLAQLEAPQADALVNAGWRQVGLVEVEGDVEFALRRLWHDTLHAMAWLLALYAAAMTAMLLWLRRLLAPLAAVERIAAAAALRRIMPIETRPRVRELASFVAGFNRLAGMVNDRIAEEEARAERFRAAALVDRTSGMANRLGLETALAGASPIWLGLFTVNGLDEVNRNGGYAAGDALIATLADAVRASFPDAVLARLHAATFAVALDDGTEAALRETTRALLTTLERRAAGHGVEAVRPMAGWTAALPGAAVTTLLSAADQALAAAADADGVTFVGTERGATDAPGAQSLVRRVVEAIEAGHHTLSWQTVVSVPDGKAVQTEVFLRLYEPDGALIAAQRFLPLLRRERETSFLDRAMLERLCSSVAAGALPRGPLAVNLDADTFAAGSLPDWMASVLDGWPADYPLVFELRECDVVAAPAAAESFAAALFARGFAVALDHFGLHAGGIAALRRLLPRYVKLDASLSRGLDAVERRFQVEALVRAARSLEVPVWAQVFDNPGALEVLAEMGIVGAQGYTLAAEVLPSDTRRAAGWIADSP